VAITVDQATLGTSTTLTAGTTHTLTTTAAVASGGLIVIFIGFLDSGYTDVISSVSGGSLDWTLHTGSTGVGAGIATAYAPSGLASSTVITVTWGGSVDAKLIAGMSFLGCGEAARVTGTPSSNGSITGTPKVNWACPAITTTVHDAVVLGAAFTSQGSPTSTPGTGWTEAHDFKTSGQDMLTTVYQIVSTAGAYTPSGTWSTDRASSFGDGHSTVAIEIAGISGTQINFNSGANAWSNVTNAKYDDGSVASVSSGGAGANTDRLVCHNFGVSLPAGSTIDGIEAHIDWVRGHTSNVGYIGLTKDTGANLAGSWKAMGGTDKRTWGTSSDKWGTTWSKADVEASAFGVMVYVEDNLTDGTCTVDYLQITIYYTVPDAVDLTASLYEGTTLIKSWPHASIGERVNVEQTLSASEANSIGNYGNLRLRFSAVEG